MSETPMVPQRRQPRSMLDLARNALNARMSKDDLRLVLENVVTYASELERQRNAFRDQRNNVFAKNEHLLAEVQESDQARLLAENETRTVKREFAEAAATVARLVQERGDRMKVENALRDEVEDLRARVAELLAERHSTNESLSDAAETLRVQRDRIAALEGQLAGRDRPVDEDPIAYTLTPEAEASAGRLSQMLAPAVEGEHYASVHHGYRLGRDLPQTGGA
ncbi:hypothetical protein GCM10018980_51160 [Streptomyces capoamus]|uniref:Uncharacterized protein n=1 Tax=Streptomyces capoamus TaxID=68183 RepID=A0A919KE16_9ACTN|nr:hypothetical protein [Streptomyces capoamus]GGW15866.1 hypothetical protein GCM10010501_29650 [Streptomyces libani subsp. rufus]GHG61760.1 hypothetical protein GCM10018980_51160 [Streptomyces capoamus]